MSTECIVFIGWLVGFIIGVCLVYLFSLDEGEHEFAAEAMYGLAFFWPLVLAGYVIYCALIPLRMARREIREMRERKNLTK